MALLDDLFGGNAGANPLDQIRNGLLGDLLTRMKSGQVPAVGTQDIVASMPKPETPVAGHWETTVAPMVPPLGPIRNVTDAPGMTGFPNQSAAPAVAAQAPAARPDFAPTFGNRMVAFGKALQGQDPGDVDRMADVKNQTFDFLTRRGVSTDDAKAIISNPQLFQSVLPMLTGSKSKLEVTEIYDAQGRKQKVAFNPLTGATTPLGGAANATTDVKPPSGYEWIDPTDTAKGLRAIEGGPATKLGQEMAGKLALMDAAQKEINATKDTLLKPWGLVGSGQSLASKVPFVGDISMLSGDIGIASRNVRAGIEAALRVMTGAAAPEQEVVRYMEMFMPGVNDTKESAQQKLKLLDDFMNNARAILTQGRDPKGAGAAAPAAGGKPDRATAIAEAQRAIAAGKDPDAVRARLRQWGYELD